MSTAAANAPKISLTDFVDFIITAGPPKLTKVRTIKEREAYSPQTDFWRPLRKAIQKFHENGNADKKQLESLIEPYTDAKKLNRYPAALQGYKKFLGKKEISWFEPPHQTWKHAGLEVRINPELGLQWESERHVIKLYFKDEQPTKNRLAVIHEVMNQVLLPTLSSGAQMSVLDVGRGKLLVSSPGGYPISPLLEAEALAFMSLWNSL